MKTISQTEARRLRKRVVELERTLSLQRCSWVREYPGGIHLGTITRVRDWLNGRIEGARLLKHAVVVVDEENKLKFYAIPQG